MTTSTPKKKAAPRKKASSAPPPHIADAGVEDQPVSTPAGFKSTATTLLTLPSGHTIRAQNPGLRAFLGTGIIPNSLMGIITEALDKRAQPDVSKLTKNGQVDFDMAKQMYEMYDAVACRVFVEPKCHPVPVDGVNADGTPEDRDNLLYVDEVDDEDKLFIFGWVSNGTRDVETFRSELRKNMAAIPGGEDAGSEAVGAAGNRAQRRARK